MTIYPVSVIWMAVAIASSSSLESEFEAEGNIKRYKKEEAVSTDNTDAFYDNDTAITSISGSVTSKNDNYIETNSTNLTSISTINEDSLLLLSKEDTIDENKISITLSIY